MEHRIPRDVPPTPLGDYLPRALPSLPRWALRQVLAQRQVKRDGARLDARALVRGGEMLRIYLPQAALARADAPAEAAAEAAPLALPIVFEDARLLVVNKPQGLSAQGADDPHGQPGVLEHLRRRAAARGENPDALWLCHRLDVQTGGLLLLAKTEPVYEAVLDAFAHHAIEKHYTCLTVGTPAPPEAVAQAYLRKHARDARVTVRTERFPGALPIQTGYRVLAAGEIARVAVSLITGRTHQIRAHMAFLGCPILGDDKYGDRQANRRLNARTQRLWATGLTLRVGGVLADADGLSLTVPFPFPFPDLT